MKKLVRHLPMTVILLAFFSNYGVSAESNSEERVIITFNDEINNEIIDTVNGEVNYEFQNMPVAAVTLTEDAIEELEKNSTVKRVEKDLVIRSSSQIEDWGIPALNIPITWGTGYSGKGIKIAVIDTGISPHEDLVIAGGKSFVDYTDSYFDDNGHGTHVAGIIRASNNGVGIKGVAYESDIFAIKAMTQNGTSYLSSIIAGIDWAITNDMDIVNLSLGTQVDSTAFHNIVDRAYRQGLLIVAASGNDGTGIGDTVDYPARYSSAIAVGAVDQQNQLASFSSTGSSVEVVAPGVSIVSTYLNGKYARMNGTSMATPFVTGYLALVKQAYPQLTNAQIRTKLNESTVDLGLYGLDNSFGYGLLKATSLSLPVSGYPATGNPAISLTLNKSKSIHLPNESEELTATVQLKDGTKLDITDEAVWSISDTTIANINFGKINTLKIGKTEISAQWGGLTSTMELEVIDSNPVLSIESNIDSLSATTGQQKKITLTARMKDGTFTDITNGASWRSLNETIASVNKGTVDFKQVGRTTIIASYGNESISINVESTLEVALPDLLDVNPTFWAYKEINELREKEIIFGYKDNTFKPNATIRRDHVASIFSKSLPLTFIVEEKRFLDVPTNYLYYQEIMNTQRAGIFSGSNGVFGPQQQLTRAQMAKILVIAFELNQNGLHSFKDVSENHWANEYIHILYSNGITLGSNGLYSPEDFVTRAQYAVFLSRAMELKDL